MRIFVPWMVVSTNELFDPTSNFKLVHYTTVDTAIKIINGREVWLRNTRFVNDESEIRHGIELLDRYFGATGHEADGKAYTSAVNSVSPNLGDTVLFDTRAKFRTLLDQTYVACVSRHSPREEKIGRLSMWRAYGLPSGAALVLNVQPFKSLSNVLKAYSAPVQYSGYDEFRTNMDRAARLIEKERDFLRSIPPTAVAQVLQMLFVFMIACTKHAAFYEEQEWRVLYMPELMRSAVIVPFSTSVKGVDQTVYQMPLKNYPALGLTGMEIQELVSNVIIGPSPSAATDRDLLVAALTDAGIADAGAKVSLSEVPLRP
jgi:hypothetical protein